MDVPNNITKIRFVANGYHTFIAGSKGRRMEGTVDLVETEGKNPTIL